MQVYLQYKYYITVTKLGGQHPILRPGIRSPEVRGEHRYENGSTAIIQQQRQVCKRICSTYTMDSTEFKSGVLPKRFGHQLLLFLSAQLDNV